MMERESSATASASVRKYERLSESATGEGGLRPGKGVCDESATSL